MLSKKNILIDIKTKYVRQHPCCVESLLQYISTQSFSPPCSESVASGGLGLWLVYKRERERCRNNDNLQSNRKLVAILLLDLHNKTIIKRDKNNHSRLSTLKMMMTLINDDVDDGYDDDDTDVDDNDIAKLITTIYRTIPSRHICFKL